ncbi:MAG: DUF4886 domain-containing protein [Bacteroidaceae bacterium]|nr:DUF4886 domain-containing protein [Bacteroidaceae bacterium]
MKRIIWFGMLVVLCLQGMAQTNNTANGKTMVVRKTTVVKKTTVPKSTNTTTTKIGTSTAKTASTTTAKPKTTTTTTTMAKQTTPKTDKAAFNEKTLADNQAQKESLAIQQTTGYLYNSPLPYLPPKLDVLFVGNSFSIDTSSALPSILNSLGINNVNVYVLYKGGCSMKQHYEFYKSGENVYELYCYNSQGEQQLERAISIGEVMQRFPYDVVVWQQYSLESGDYSTYEPYLSKLIQAYNITRLSARTTFAFNETWAYASNNKNLTKYQTQKNMWKNISTSVRKMKAASGIDVIIPCGTAVQNAREVEALNVDNELTRDGTHINIYAGRYLLACTFFESIIAPCLNRSIREDNTVYGKNTDVGQVTDENRLLLQNCARLAVANNYEISEFAGQ